MNQIPNKPYNNIFENTTNSIFFILTVVKIKSLKECNFEKSKIITTNILVNLFPDSTIMVADSAVIVIFLIF